MTYPKISIITPSYNQGKYIEQTILSVIEQNYPNLEYIIIDGGSTDETVEVIKKYEKHIAYWVSEKDNGQTDAINKGFAKCSGEIFNWLNSDDYYEPGALHKIAAHFSANPSINVVCAKEWGFNNDDPTDRILHPGSIIKEDVFKTIQIGIIDQPCTFFKKRAIDAYLPLDTDLRYVMDRHLWWAYLLGYGQDNIIQTNDILVNFRMHTESKSVFEGHKFENEFDRLKLTLFQQLKAPDFLIAQLEGVVQPLAIHFNIRIPNEKLVLAEFATYFAERQYVHDNIDAVSILMKFVKQAKGMRMSTKEWKLWMIGSIVPKQIFWLLKTLKKKVA